MASTQEEKVQEGLQEIKVTLDEMRLAGFDVIYGDKLPDWAHPGTVAGFRRKFENGRYDVKWIYNFLNHDGVTGWTTGDPMEPMELDACLEKLTHWLQSGVWDEEESKA